MAKKTHNHEIFSATGVYKLICSDCGESYISQTGRNFSKRYNENLRVPLQTIAIPQNLLNILILGPGVA